MPTVEESFAYCRRVARSRARNFHYAFLLLPREKKEAMCAIYAFMRYCDDISDSAGAIPAPTIRSRQELLDRWKKTLEAALQGDYGDSLIMPAFHRTAVEYEIPSEYFFELIEGVGRDLTPQRYRSFDDLYRYCYQVASVVGMTVVHVFGYDSPEALRLAEKCGIAFQLTNILRDIPEDAALGRVYLPEEDLEKFGLCRDDLLQGRLQSPERQARFQGLMQFEWARAKRYYEEAAPLLGMVRPKSRPALWAMIAIYYGVLRRIRKAGYDVYAKRARLSGLEKMWIVLRAAKLRLTGGALPFPA